MQPAVVGAVAVTVAVVMEAVMAVVMEAVTAAASMRADFTAAVGTPVDFAVAPTHFTPHRAWSTMSPATNPNPTSTLLPERILGMTLLATAWKAARHSTTRTP
jgi:hypothetical protein